MKNKISQIKEALEFYADEELSKQNDMIVAQEALQSLKELEDMLKSDKTVDNVARNMCNEHLEVFWSDLKNKEKNQARQMARTAIKAIKEE